jgi:hypothetical protein
MRKLLFILLVWSTAYAQTPTKQMPYEIYDFSNFARDEFSTGFHPLNWFTGFASHDPKNNGGSSTDTAGKYTEARLVRPEHYPQGFSDANGGTYYAGDRGYMLLFDMAGDKNMFKISGAKTKITDIDGLQIDGDRGDTLFFYKGDDLFNLPANQVWLTLGRCDSLMTPFAKLVQGTGIASTWGWNSVTGMTDSMRYILVVMRRKNHGTFSTFATFNELVIYGTKMYDPATINTKQWQYTGPLPKCPPISQFGGTNNVGVEVSQIPDGKIRDYSAVGDWDHDTVPFPFNTINPLPFSYSQSFWEQEFPNAIAAGKFRWETIRAGSKRLEAYGAGNVAKSLPVTEPFMEPEDYHSYARYGNFFYHYASIMGSNPNHTDAEFRWNNKPAWMTYGSGHLPAVEPGNEDESRGSTPLAMVVYENVAYDGYEGRTPNAGMKLGDSTMKFIMPATVFIDTAMYKSMIFLCRLGRSDHKVIWDYFNGHHYSREYRDPSVTSHDPTFEEMWGARGARPEWDRMYERVTSAINVIQREIGGDTSKKFMLTEWGYDNWVQPSISVAWQNYDNPYGMFWTISTVPTPPGGEDSLRTKSKMIIRGMSIFATTHMSGWNEYNITPVFYDPIIKPGLFYSAGRGAADSTGVIRNTLIHTKWPNYWAVASFYSAMNNYAVDALLSLDSIGKCIIKWRNVNHPDSVCYEIWKGSNNGSSLGGQSINVGSVVGNANKYTLSYTSTTGATTLQAISSGVMSYTATEEPAMYFMQETGGPTSNSFIKHHKKTNFVPQ